jgi:hypothetical protein
MDVARAKYRSKIDLSNAYEQMRVDPKDIWKTVFATIAETMVSHVLQIGDCNGPASWQHLMTAIFRDHLGIFVHVYLNDIFVFSNSIEEHKRHLKIINSSLKKRKCALYAEVVDCLGFRIDKDGIHVSTDKMEWIRNWRTPCDVTEVQRFLGLVQYIRQFIPDLATYAEPLSASCSEKKSFSWRPLHDRCFEMIKALACKTPVIRPIDPSTGEPIWLICDASATGVGAMYGQGGDWKTCHPAGFMSRKFTNTQFNYKTWDCEVLVIIEGFMKWEDKLLGRCVNVVTDHEALEFFKDQKRFRPASVLDGVPREIRLLHYLHRWEGKPGSRLLIPVLSK